MFIPQTLLHPFKMQFLIGYLHKIDTIPGCVVEIGIYKGGTLLEIAKWIGGRKHVFGYDTFEGLPDPSPEDLTGEDRHGKGDFSDVNYFEMKQFFKDYDVTLIKGEFPWCAIDRKIAFAHLDVDFYEATKHSLEWMHSRLAKQAIVVVDDYGWPKTPGVKKAVNELIIAGLYKVIDQSSAYQIVLGAIRAERKQT